MTTTNPTPQDKGGEVIMRDYVEYRKKTNPPTKPGWYYARKFAAEEIYPVLYRGDDWFSIDGKKNDIRKLHVNSDWYHISYWEWYGPVITVREDKNHLEPKTEVME